MPTKTRREIQKIAEQNLGLVRQQAHRFVKSSDLSFDELMSIGTMGLMRAVENFDDSKGAAFSSFAVPYIRGSILHHFRDGKDRLIRNRRGEQHPFVNSLDAEIPGTESLTKLEAIADTYSDNSEEWDIIDSLESPYKEVLILKAEGFTQAEIATKFSVSPVTVWRWIKQARSQLKNIATEDSQLVSLRKPNRRKGLTVPISPEQPSDSRLITIKFKKDKIQVTQDHINQLPEQQRRVVELTMVGNLRAKQVADRLGLKPAHISQLRRMSFDDLRKIKLGIYNPKAEPHPDKPTKAEQAVLDLIRLGLSTREIASRLFCQTRTIESHIQHLNIKAGISGHGNRIKLIAWASKNGYCEPLEQTPENKKSPVQIRSEFLTELDAEIDAHHHQIQEEVSRVLAESKAELIRRVDRYLDILLHP